MQQNTDLSEHIPPEAVDSIFAAAEMLYRAAPWAVLDSEDRLLVDVAALGITQACATVVGALGEAFGVLLFPSSKAHRKFMSHVDDVPKDGRIVDCGTDYLDLALIRGADLPSKFRRTIVALGLPVADARAYPLPRHVSRDCTTQPLTLRDAQILAATSHGLACFTHQHHRALAVEGPRVAKIAGTYTSPEGVDVAIALGCVDIQAAH